MFVKISPLILLKQKGASNLKMQHFSCLPQHYFSAAALRRRASTKWVAFRNARYANFFHFCLFSFRITVYINVSWGNLSCTKVFKKLPSLRFGFVKFPLSEATRFLNSYAFLHALVQMATEKWEGWGSE